MNLLDRFINIPEDAVYDQMKDYKVTVPDNFNFSYDVVDVYARECPDKKAMVWCDDNEGEEIFTFREISQWSKRAANFFVSKGIKKGDRV
ncbi:MAG: acetyl-CoA synthetase, partial [Treponema sp.]|nr:acetyl-CoA synthetase [Treponema sp.]